MIGFFDSGTWDAIDDAVGWLPATVGAHAVSTIARMQAEKAARQKREQFLQAERARQLAIQQQANQQIDTALAGLTPGAQQQAVQRGVDTRMAASEQRARPADPAVSSGEYIGVSSNAPTVVKQAAAKAIVDALEKGQDYSRTLAGVKGFGDARQSTGINLGRTGQQINQLQGFSRGSQAVLPAELAGAQSAGSGWRVAHDRFGEIGQLGTIYGAGFMDAHNKRRRDPTMSYLYGTGRISD